jgi:hypothetical protein
MLENQIKIQLRNRLGDLNNNIYNNQLDSCLRLYVMIDQRGFYSRLII